MEPNNDRVKLMVYWICAREDMRLHKEAGGAYPHSKDPLMSSVRYCNVRREDDKVTKWVAKFWRDNRKGHTPNMPVAMTLARMVNNPDTLELMEWPDTWDKSYEEHVLDILRKRALDGHKVWSSAYMISTCGKPMPKSDYVVRHVCRAVAEKIPMWHSQMIGTLERAHKQLMTVDGLGSFLAAQVVADLKNQPENLLSYATDWHTWSAHGPGSLRGLAALYGGATVTPSAYPAAIAGAWRAVCPLLPVGLQSMHMQDFQNCLCEFSKYMRVRAGGMARNNYRG